MKKKIAITGVGCISPWGDNLPSFKLGYKESTSNFNLIDNFNLKNYVNKKGLRALPKSTKMAIASTKLALDDANLSLNEESEMERIGVFVGNSMSYLGNVSAFLENVYENNANLVSPSKFPTTVPHNISGWVSIVFNIKGINSTVNTGNTSGIDAIIQAKSYIENGVIDKAIVVGVEDINKSIIHNEFNGDLPDKKMTESSISLIIEKTIEEKGKYGYINDISSWMDYAFNKDTFHNKVLNFIKHKPQLNNVILGSGNTNDSIINGLLNEDNDFRFDKENVAPYIGVSYSLSGLIKLILSLFSNGETMIVETNETGNNCLMIIETKEGCEYFV